MSLTAKGLHLLRGGFADDILQAMEQINAGQTALYASPADLARLVRRNACRVDYPNKLLRVSKRAERSLSYTFNRLFGGQSSAQADEGEVAFVELLATLMAKAEQAEENAPGTFSTFTHAMAGEVLKVYYCQSAHWVDLLVVGRPSEDPDELVAEFVKEVYAP